MKMITRLLVLLLSGMSLLRADQNQATAPTGDDLLKLGMVRLQQQDWHGAATAFDQALALEPNLDMAYVGLGEAKMHTDSTDEALADFTQALRINTNNQYAYADRASLRNDSGDVAGALDDLNQALRIDPPWQQILFFRGMTYLRENRWNEAMADFQSLQNIDPSDPRWHIGAGLIKRVHNDPKGAMSELNSACQATPPLLSALLNRAELHEELGELPAAEADFRTALNYAENEEIASIHIDLGLVEWEANQPDASLMDFHVAANLAGGKKVGDYPHFFIWLIGKEQKDPNADAALATFLSIHQYQHPNDWVGKVGAFLLGQMKEEDLFKAALTPGEEEVSEQTCEAWYYSGMKLLLAGEKEEAIAHFQKCVAQQKIFFLEYLLSEGKLRNLAPSTLSVK